MGSLRLRAGGGGGGGDQWAGVRDAAECVVHDRHVRFRLGGMSTRGGRGVLVVGDGEAGDLGDGTGMGFM